MNGAGGSPEEAADITVIGAGVVGLAVAAALASPERMLVVVERNPTFGLETSGHNSCVIHAGLYYPAGSHMARFCVDGNRSLYAHCRAYGVAHRRIGKLVVATDAREEALLHELHARAAGNGVADIAILSEREVRAREPNVRACAALYSGATGIIETQELMQSLCAQAEAAGAYMMYETSVVAIERAAGGYRVETRRADGSPYRFATRVLINCAGLGADTIAEMAGIDVDACGYRQRYCKGEYFSLRAGERTSFNHLVYPVPHAPSRGLGVHVTVTIDGRIVLGPDTTYVDRDRADYSVDESKRGEFFEATRRFIPGVTLDALEPAFAGIRPKLTGPGEPPRDFVITHEQDRGLAGFFNLIGIESPGLTACLEIARHVRAMVDESGVAA